MKELALTLPGGEKIQALGNVPNVGISPIIQTAATLLFVIAIILSLFFLVLGGIRWIISEGDKTKLQQARATLTYAVVGLIIVFLSFFIINVVGELFGINLLQISLPTGCYPPPCIAP